MHALSPQTSVFLPVEFPDYSFTVYAVPHHFCLGKGKQLSIQAKLELPKWLLSPSGQLYQEYLPYIPSKFEVQVKRVQPFSFTSFSRKTFDHVDAAFEHLTTEMLPSSSIKGFRIHKEHEDGTSQKMEALIWGLQASPSQSSSK